MRRVYEEPRISLVGARLRVYEEPGISLVGARLRVYEEPRISLVEGRLRVYKEPRNGSWVPARKSQNSNTATRELWEAADNRARLALLHICRSTEIVGH